MSKTYFHTYEPVHACARCGWHIVDENGRCVWCGAENPKGRLPLTRKYQDVEGCPQCGGLVRFFVGDAYGKCLSCGESVPIIEGE